MVIWSHARQSFAKHIAYQSGRTLAALAIMDGKRRPLSWVWGHIWKGLIDEFQDQGISNKVAADIMGCTLRTYQRRFSEYTEPCDEVGLNIWFRIYDALKTPLSADQVVVKFHHYKKREILSILSDMAKSNWIERDEQDRYCKVESYETWDLEMLCEYVHAYNHLSGKQNCTPEEFEQHTGLPRDAWQVAIDRISEQEIEYFWRSTDALFLGLRAMVSNVMSISRRQGPARFHLGYCPDVEENHEKIETLKQLMDESAKKLRDRDDSMKEAIIPSDRTFTWVATWSYTPPVEDI